MEELRRTDGAFLGPFGWRPTGGGFSPEVGLTYLDGIGGFLDDVRLFRLDPLLGSCWLDPALNADPVSEPRRDGRAPDALLLLLSMLEVLFLLVRRIRLVSCLFRPRPHAAVLHHM